MNEVEKMYRNAHVYPRVYGDITKETFENKVFNMGDMCNEAFTADKQIEIIKFLIGRYAMFKKFRSYEQKDLYMVYYECKYFPKQYLPFEEALAESVNHLWQDLTEEERKQIKNILESEVRE